MELRCNVYFFEKHNLFLNLCLGAASHGWSYFKYCVINKNTGKVEIIPVKPISFS